MIIAIAGCIVGDVTITAVAGVVDRVFEHRQDLLSCERPRSRGGYQIGYGGN